MSLKQLIKKYWTILKYLICLKNNWLEFKKKYEAWDSLKQLRYDKLMIMTDRDYDHDGSHIKGK